MSLLFLPNMVGSWSSLSRLTPSRIEGDQLCIPFTLSGQYGNGLTRMKPKSAPALHPYPVLSIISAPQMSWATTPTHRDSYHECNFFTKVGSWCRTSSKTCVPAELATTRLMWPNGAFRNAGSIGRMADVLTYVLKKTGRTCGFQYPTAKAIWNSSSKADPCVRQLPQEENETKRWTPVPHCEGNLEQNLEDRTMHETAATARK